ncbi:MAG: hypothetical protein QXJ73_08870 [Candidatus Caldarchaeum sp.]
MVEDKKREREDEEPSQAFKDLVSDVYDLCEKYFTPDGVSLQEGFRAIGALLGLAILSLPERDEGTVKVMLLALREVIDSATSLVISSPNSGKEEQGQSIN